MGKLIHSNKLILQIGAVIIAIVLLATPYVAFAQEGVLTLTPTAILPTPSDSVLTAEPTDTLPASETASPSATETPTFEFTQTPAPTLPAATATPDKFLWNYSIAFPKGLTKKADSFLSAMNSLNIPGARSSKSSALDMLQFNGKRDVNEVRKALFPGKDSGFGLIDGASDINLSFPVNSLKPVTLRLESDLSTGYSWQILNATINGVGLSSSSTFVARGGGAVPQMQVITFTPANTGTATIHLAYRRSFNMGEVSTRSLSVAFGDAQQSVDLSNPTPEMGGVASGTGGSSAAVTATASSGLPSVWDWRTFGAVTPIRDQGIYGTCWAFSTVGTMESNMLVNGGPSANLSEQFLVSCNKLGFTADSGGYPLHDYHTSVIANLQSVTGAVLETDFPYSPSTAVCKTVSNHPYKLSNWGYAAYSTPDTATIKAALYNHGPVSTGVCAGSTFSRYTGGYFTTDESATCSGSINHYVVLVGWKDVSSTEGYWILRNSWGTNWGDSGYMYIKYGISSVGQWTSWVDYTATNSPTPIEPIGNVTAAYPTFKWNSVSSATSYEVQVFQNNIIVIDNTFSSSICSSGTCSTPLASSLMNGSLYWRVRAQVAGTWGTYTRPVAIAVDIIPATATPTTQPTEIPTFTPTAVPTEASPTPSETPVPTDVPADPSATPESTVEPSAVPTETPITPTASTQPSEEPTFTQVVIPSNTPVTPSPTASPTQTPVLIPTNQPTQTLSAVTPSASPTKTPTKTPTKIVTKTPTKTAAVSTSTSYPTQRPTSTSTLRPTSTPLTPTSTFTNTPWVEPSATATLVPVEPTPTTVVTELPPAIPVLLGPGGVLYDGKVTLQWNMVENASLYVLNLYSYTKSAVVYSETIDASNEACKEGVCTYIPDVVFENDSYSFAVAALNPSGASPFSTPTNFSICGNDGFDYAFNANATCWVPSNGATWTVNANYYYGTGRFLRWATTSYPASFDNFALEAYLWRDGGTRSRYESGLVFRGTPNLDSSNKWTSGYFFMYRNDGSFTVYKRVNGRETSFIKWTQSSAIHKGNWNDLRVEVNGNSITCYINGVQVWQGSDSSLSSGLAGFTFYNGIFPSRLYIDSVSLTKP